MNKFLVAWCLFLTIVQPLTAQSKASPKEAKDIDPLALQVLKAATDPIKNAKSFSFRAIVSRDLLGTNDQIITVFNTHDVTIQRPNKMHIRFRGRGEPVEMFFDGSGKTVLYSPSAKFYTPISTPTTIDGTLAAVAKRGVDIPMRNFLETDPFQSLTDGLLTAYAVGKVTLDDVAVYHLAFTEPGAEWQLWVVGDEKPTIRRLEIISTDKPRHPRITVEFFDWNLNEQPAADLFTFNKSADAQEIEMLKTAEGSK